MAKDAKPAKDAKAGKDTKAKESKPAKAGDKYVVLQVVLTEKLIGTGSGTASLSNLQAAINKQAAKGYRLHTISVASSGSKSILGGDKIQATMVFERLD